MRAARQRHRRSRATRARNENIRSARRVLAIVLLASIPLVSATALTNNITVATTYAYNKTHTIALAELMPTQCSTLGITRIHLVTTNTTTWGGANDANALRLGNTGADIDATIGDDCVVPGANTSGSQIIMDGGNTGENNQCYWGPPNGTATYWRWVTCTNAGGPPYNTIVTANPAFA